jgi:hypothetical protein
MYVPRTTTADNPNDTELVPKYKTDDEYMSAITSLINIEIIKNVDKAGKLVKDYTNLGGIQDVSDNIYNNLLLYKQQCLQLSSPVNIDNCYTDSIKMNCEKISAILNNTGTINDPLPTSETTTTSSITSTTAAGTTTTLGGGTTTTSGGGTTTTSGGGTTTTLGGGTTTTSSGTTTTASGGEQVIFNRASQEEWKKFWDDIAILFTGRVGDVGETANTLMSLTQDQRNSICSTYCNGIYAECTDICRLAKCSNCDNEPAPDLTGPGNTGSEMTYSLWGNGLLDNTDDTTWAMNTNGSASKFPGASVLMGDGVSNVFAPYISIMPPAQGSSNGYSAYLMNDQNNMLYMAYISQLMSEYANVIPSSNI